MPTVRARREPPRGAAWSDTTDGRFPEGGPRSITDLGVLRAEDLGLLGLELLVGEQAIGLELAQLLDAGELGVLRRGGAAQAARDHRRRVARGDVGLDAALGEVLLDLVGQL